MKQKVLIFLFFLSLMIISFLNSPKIGGNENLSALIKTAIAAGESSEGCYIQVMGPMYEFINGCWREQERTFDCWEGSSPQCEQGTVILYWNECTNEEDDYDGRNTLFCS